MDVHTITAFPEPQWRWVGAEKKENYGFLSNEVTINYLQKQKKVLVTVPTEIFLFLQQMLPTKYKDIKVGKLYLDQLDNQYWVFGINYDKEYIDLWVYANSGLPAVFSNVV